jgi:hypothetical protein
MSERERRVGANEALFRSVNEQVRGLNQTLTTHNGSMLVVCECGNTSCMERIEVTTDEYAEVRRDSTLFVVKPGHEILDTERVVSSNDRFGIVQKDPGLPAEIARATDSSA